LRKAAISGALNFKLRHYPTLWSFVLGKASLVRRVEGIVRLPGAYPHSKPPQPMQQPMPPPGAFVPPDPYARVTHIVVQP